ncbi:MAG: VWA domain-containing protein [Pseudomonadota bacterium]
MGETRSTLPSAKVAQFLKQASATPVRGGGGRGRLIFGLDATMSRQPTWDLACHLQAELFDAASKAGGLDVKLAYFRGYDEARASRWISDAAALNKVMSRIDCRCGLTQISRLLDHTLKEASDAPVAAFVYVGDTMEEDIDQLCARAGKLALHNTKAFMFQEGHDPVAERAYREIARITGGVFLRFDPRAPERLRSLLAAIGTYAAGGRAALETEGSREARLLLEGMSR